MYETGFVVAFGLWIFNAIAIIVAVNSTFSKNLRKIGQRVSWSTFRPAPMDASDLNKSTSSRVAKYLFITLLNLPFTLLSWVYVVAIASMVIYGRSKDTGKPQAFRELAWKMRNIEMTFDQIVSELGKAEGLDSDGLTQLRVETIDGLRQRGLPVPN